MDRKTGRIYDSREQAVSLGVQVEYLMTGRFTLQQLSRRPPRVEAYELCPCGSGKKFQFCCKKKTVR